MLFRHVQRLTTGVLAFADELRSAGHTVQTPDLLEGRTFESIEAGQGFLEEVGFDEVDERGTNAVDGLPAEAVYAGFSLGVLCCSTRSYRRSTSVRGPTVCTYRSTRWMATPSSSARATSNPRERS